MYLEFDSISSISRWVIAVHQENSLEFAKPPKPALGSLCCLAFSQLLGDCKIGLINYTLDCTTIIIPIREIVQKNRTCVCIVYFM